MNRLEAGFLVIAEVRDLGGDVAAIDWHPGGQGGSVLWRRPYPPRPDETEWVIHDVYVNGETAGLERGRYFQGDAAEGLARVAFGGGK